MKYKKIVCLSISFFCAASTHAMEMKQLDIANKRKIIYEMLPVPMLSFNSLEDFSTNSELREIYNKPPFNDLHKLKQKDFQTTDKFINQLEAAPQESVMDEQYVKKIGSIQTKMEAVAKNPDTNKNFALFMNVLAKDLLDTMYGASPYHRRLALQAWVKKEKPTERFSGDSGLSLENPWKTKTSPVGKLWLVAKELRKREQALQKKKVHTRPKDSPHKEKKTSKTKCCQCLINALKKSS